jgi:hypothetical protein
MFKLSCTLLNCTGNCMPPLLITFLFQVAFVSQYPVPYTKAPKISVGTGNKLYHHPIETKIALTNFLSGNHHQPDSHTNSKPLSFLKQYMIS